MLLHIGNEIAVPKRNIIAIFAYDAFTAVPSREFLRAVRDEDRLVTLSEQGKERSVVVTTGRVFVTSISCHTLKRRAESIILEELEG